MSDLKYLRFIISVKATEVLDTQSIANLAVGQSQSPEDTDAKEINWRQMDILKFLSLKLPQSEVMQRSKGKALRGLSGKDGAARLPPDGNRYIDVHWCMNKFDISDRTARRDWVELVKQGRLKRWGRARATKYGSVESSRELN